MRTDDQQHNDKQKMQRTKKEVDGKWVSDDGRGDKVVDDILGRSLGVVVDSESYVCVVFFR